ncbi:MAG: hypothetical protein EZS28_020063, partial [Streblomastix strix]
MQAISQLKNISRTNSPSIPEVEPQLEKEAVVQQRDPFQQLFQEQVIKCETPTLSVRRRNQIFEKILAPDPQLCRWLLDIISEDRHMIGESAHFVQSENQLVLVVAYTFDVPESQIQLDVQDEGCCGRFCNDSTQTINQILIGNLNILKLDVEKINLLRDNYKIYTYTKQQGDALLLLKADKTEFDNYVDLISTQTITSQKQFGIITVSCISKQNKNDVSILVAGGGDMLVSSLVSQPQLQELRDITSGKSKDYFFATTDEMNTWMENQENVAKLAIGDNLYIVDKQVMEYWSDGTGLRALETELPDMSNTMIIIGIAIGGGNAITDLSFDGNTLIPAKNSSFITTNYDETITGQKTFYTTIHSVGISVQNYDNNSVVCAGGGVKAIQDINAS